MAALMVVKMVDMTALSKVSLMVDLMEALRAA